MTIKFNEESTISDSFYEASSKAASMATRMTRMRHWDAAIPDGGRVISVSHTITPHESDFWVSVLVTYETADD